MKVSESMVLGQYIQLHATLTSKRSASCDELEMKKVVDGAELNDDSYHDCELHGKALGEGTKSNKVDFEHVL